MKIKSVSVENLGNIVRQMVNAALEDSDQIAKLHQAIYEEWYFKKMIELEDATSKTENVKNTRKISQRISYPLSNLTRNISDSNSLMDTSNEIKYLMKDLNNIKIIKHDKSAAQDIPIMCNKSVEANICIKYSERTGSEISEDQKHMINNNAPSLEIIEVWNNPTQKARIRKKLESNIIDHQNRNQNKEKLVKQVRRLSFESWKNEKNLMYRKLLKEKEEKKQQELQKKLKNIEYKKASQETYAQIIKEKEIQQKKKLSVKQLQVIQQINIDTLKKQIDDRRIINDQAFNIWKKQKDMKLKEMKLITTENVPYYQLKRSVGSSITFTNRSSSQFDSWLDQLDNILHQKYLRERRHLVRSFYCQPTYYGAMTMCYT